MKLVKFFLACYFFNPSFCNTQSAWLTDDDITKFFGRRNASVPTYGIAEVRMPHKRSRRDAEEIWRLSINFTDHNTRFLNLKRTDGVLANLHTPVWYARSRRNSDKISYTRHRDLKHLGRFEFYQDFNEKAAVVVFRDLKRIEGFIDYYQFEEASNQLKGKSTKRYVLIPRQSSKPIHTFGIPIDPKVRNETIDHNRLRIHSAPTFYPQLLIQLERCDVHADLMKTLMNLLIYWNAVDMLYSNFENPRIKLNVAGLIVPMDDYTAPWITKSQLSNYPDTIDTKVGLKELGSHFTKYAHVFPPDQYDFMISFTSKALDSTLSTFGVAYMNGDCQSRERSVALIYNDLSTYVVGTHELGHLLSIDHDENTTDCRDSRGIMGSTTTGTANNFQWSVCSKHSVQSAMTKQNTMCLNNCPQTKHNCQNEQLLSEASLPCAHDPVKLCREHRLSFGGMACNDTILCIGGPTMDRNVCTLSSIPVALQRICQLVGSSTSQTNYFFPVQNGDLCNTSESGSAGVCYEGGCRRTTASLTLCGA